ncbi:queuosine-tRNA galactosyltransferase isoform X2 [Eulemur rufifrons]|uniref:queuosine-tRNA galactosyltransferase isoform X2 n=1 Tax=Eulemur rufifrons TaxID=859984 RepID=UPI00374467E3
MQAPGDPAPGPGPRVSIILPVHNAEPWLDECLNSVLQQDFEGTMELSVFNDASKDKSGTIIENWKVKLEGSGILVVIGGHDSPSPRGVGYSKNQAIAQSSGSYLCFLDSIIGCRVRRDPPESTGRYTRWINRLTPDQLLTQVFTSNGPTVIMPTWFCSRAWFSHVGRFDEGGQGVPEDLLFFYEHLRKGGGVVRVDQTLLLYRYHPQAATHSVLECCQSRARGAAPGAASCVCASQKRGEWPRGGRAATGIRTLSPREPAVTGEPPKSPQLSQLQLRRLRLQGDRQQKRCRRNPPGVRAGNASLARSHRRGGHEDPAPERAGAGRPGGRARALWEGRGGSAACPSLLCPGPRSGPTASASWRSAPCRAGPPSPSGTRAGRAAGYTAASAPPAGARWSRSATWTRTRSRRASTAMRTLRKGPSPGCPSCTSEQRGRPSSSA